MRGFLKTSRTAAWLVTGISAVFLLTPRSPAQTDVAVRQIPATQTALAGSAPVQPVATNAVRAEAIRTACIEGRRCVCGRVLKVFPTGVLVESGYPTLLRDALHGAWHLPRTVVARRAPNLVERNEPDAICVGTVFLTDLPKPRGQKKEHIEPYDYVVLHSYPAGFYTYSSVGNIRHMVRCFSGGLETAVNLTLNPQK